MKETGRPQAVAATTGNSNHGSSDTARIVRSAGVVSAAVALSRISGVARETFMAHLFGAGKVYDAFSLGFRIPNLARDLFAEGALSSAFVPTFTEYLSNKGKEEAARLSSLVATAVTLGVGSFCVLGMVFSPLLVQLLAPGWAQLEPDKFALAIKLTRIMFPFLLLVALAAQAMGMLNACDKFAVPATSSTFFNMGSVAFGFLIGIVFGERLGVTPIEGMAYGVVLGGALQLAWQMPALNRLGLPLRPRIDWSHPGLRHILRLMGPAIIGGAAVQINVAINTNFASTIVDPIRGVDGPVSWLQYAFRFMQLPIGVFGVAIASATLPSISRSIAGGNLDEFRKTLSRSLGMVLLLTVPSSVGLILLGDTMIGVIYQGRKFQAYDTHQTALALSYYSIGLAAYAATKVLAPAFYALGNARIPMLVSLASIAVNFAVAWSLTRYTHLGHAGLALATSGVALFSALALFLILRVRIRGVYGRSLFDSALKVVIASLVMAAAVAFVSHGTHTLLGDTRLSRAVDLILSIPTGAFVFYGACVLLKVPELDAALRAFGGPLSRVLPGQRVRIGDNGR